MHAHVLFPKSVMVAALTCSLPCLITTNEVKVLCQKGKEGLVVVVVLKERGRIGWCVWGWTKGVLAGLSPGWRALIIIGTHLHP